MIKIPSCLSTNRSASQLNRLASLPYDNDRAAIEFDECSSLFLISWKFIVAIYCCNLLSEGYLKKLEEGMRLNEEGCLIFSHYFIEMCHLQN